MQEKAQRYHWLDEMRGLILISMIGYHLMWDLVYLYRIDCSWYKGILGYIWQQSICWSFICLSGFCWSFGRKKWKRGLEVLIAGAVITLVTIVAMPQQRVVFGVLTCIGSCMLIMIPVEKILTRVSVKMGLICSVMLFLILRNINSGTLGFEMWEIGKLPRWLYTNLFTTYLGFPQDDFFSADYFSLFPWFFLFLSGYFINRMMPEEWMKKMKNGTSKTLEVIGKNSLWIYMVHQPIIYGILLIVFS